MGYHFSPTAFVQTNLTRSPLLPHLRRMESSQTPLPPENARPSSTPIIYMPLGDVNAENEDLDEPVDPIFVSLLDEEDMDAAECSSGDRSLADPAGAVDFYSVLGVPRDAGLAEIRTSYKRLSRLLHPDRHCAIGAAFDSSMPDLELRHLRKSAQEAFGRISAAYAVLIDPNKRAIYDRFGFRGLNIDGWELALREKSAVELQFEYFKLRAKEREERQLRFTQPTSEFSLGVDMTDVFDRYLKEEPAEREIAPSLSVYEMVLKQSISAGATLRTSLSLVGEIVAQNGLGVGTWLLLCQRRFPAQSYFGPGTADVEISYGRGGKGIGLGLRFAHTFSDRLSCHLGLRILRCKWSDNWFSLAPGIGTGVSLQLTPQLKATAQLGWFINSGLSTEVVWASPSGMLGLRIGTYLRPTGKFGITVNLEKTLLAAWLAEPLSASSSDYDNQDIGARHQKTRSSSFQDDEDRVHCKEEDSGCPFDRRGRLSLMMSLNSSDTFSFGAGLTSPISTYSRLTGFIHLSLTQGITFRLTLQRGQQTYALPIRLSAEADPVAFGYGFLVPLLAFAAIRSLVYEPWLRRELERAQVFRRKRLRDELFRRRQQALATQALMKLASERQAQTEAAIKGLVIRRAVFGCISASTSDIGDIPPDAVATSVSKIDLSGPICVDVTTPLQAMVENSQLRLPPGRWSDMQGFYDPCLGLIVAPSSSASLAGQRSSRNGVCRQLYVNYEFHSALHEVLVDESQGLAIPMAKHRISSNISLPYT